MPRKQHKPDEIVAKPWHVDVAVGQGHFRSPEPASTLIAKQKAALWNLLLPILASAL